VTTASGFNFPVNGLSSLSPGSSFTCDPQA
jgi:hypothetical protein